MKSRFEMILILSHSLFFFILLFLGSSLSLGQDDQKKLNCSDLSDARSEAASVQRGFESKIKELNKVLIKHDASSLALAYEKCKKVGSALLAENIRLTRGGSASSRADLIRIIKKIFASDTEGAAQCFRSVYIGSDSGSDDTGSLCVPKDDDRLKADFGGHGGGNTDNYDSCKENFNNFVTAKIDYDMALKRIQDLKIRCETKKDVSTSPSTDAQPNSANETINNK